MVTFEFIGKTQ